MSSGAPRSQGPVGPLPYPFPLFTSGAQWTPIPRKGPNDARIHKLSQILTSSCPPFPCTGPDLSSSAQSAMHLGLSKLQGSQGALTLLEDPGGTASHVQDNILKLRQTHTYCVVI